MDATLRQLVNNPNAMSLEKLLTMLGEGEVLRSDVAKIFGEDIAGKVMAMDGQRVKLPCDKSDKTERCHSDYTKVFVWGGKGCGKTCIIGTLMAAPATDNKLEQLTITDEDSRGAMLKELFENRDELTLMPAGNSTDEQDTALHNVLLRVRSTAVTHRSYPITLIEAPLTLGGNVGPAARSILDTEGEQIHLLCIDSSGDVVRQGEMFERLLHYLDAGNYIREKTAGVFVVVTKTDMMYRVPRAYRDLAGQTLVTAKLRNLWKMVTNICYDKGIYGAVPVTYTIGDVMLQSIVTYNMSSAQRLWEEIILPKSQAEVSLLEKVLRIGNGSITAVLFAIFIGLAIYGLYNELDKDAKPPTAENMPYDYRTEFVRTVQNDIEGHDEDEYHKVAKRLRKDLEREHSIMTREGTPVLSDSDYTFCDSVLTSATNEDSEASESESWEDELERDIEKAGHKLIRELKKLF